MRPLISISLLASLFVCAPEAAAAQPGFMGLGGFLSEAYAVSADGSTVVGQVASSGYEAFRWTAETGMVGLGTLPAGGSTTAYNISADGSVIVGINNFGGSDHEAFRWTEAEGMIGLGDLPGGLMFSEARGVSGDGSVIVGIGHTATGPEAFRWTALDGMVGLGDLDGGDFESEAYGVSDDGLVIVGMGQTAAGSDAFRWTVAGGMQALGAPPTMPEPDNAGYAATPDGALVVGASRATSGGILEGFRWSEGEGLVALGDAFGGTVGTAMSRALDVSADGSIIVGDSSRSFFAPEALIWDATHGTRNLQAVLTTEYGFDLTGWTLQRATGVSADGQTIVGYGVNPDGNREAWIAVVPEPSSFVLAGLGLAAVIAVGVRKRRIL